MVVLEANSFSGPKYKLAVLGMGTLGSIIMLVVGLGWMGVLSKVDIGPLMGQIIETGTDGLYLLISSMCPFPPPDFLFFVFVSKTIDYHCFLISLYVPIWILKAMFFNYSSISALSYYQLQ